MSSLVARAPAKINLTLHVLGRRTEDGYHVLESLVAFAGVGDSLALDPGDDLTLSVSGPTAGPAGPHEDNLVLKASRALARHVTGLRTGAFRLVKRLPVAAGVGGGSSDAAAALRLLAEANGLKPDHPALLQAARETGADVPVCLAPHARMMGGAGETLGPALGLPRLPAVLVNPGVPVATAPVFKALGLAPGEAHAAGDAHPTITIAPAGADLIALLRTARNDLETPALSVAPAIGDVLSALRGTPGCRLARMSGSGATCFGLFDGTGAAEAAARTLAKAQPGWWTCATVLH